MAKCCDEWWASLDDHMKEYIHIHYYNISERLRSHIYNKIFHEMHDFRFKVELGGKTSDQR